MKKPAINSILTCAAIAVAVYPASGIAAPLTLSCAGTISLYSSEPWNSENGAKSKHTIVLNIDPEKRTMKAKHLPHFGDQKLALIVGDGHYGGQLRFSKVVDGQYLEELIVFVSRVTGEAQVNTSYYDETGKARAEIFTLFSGKCEPLRTKF